LVEDYNKELALIEKSQGCSNPINLKVNQIYYKDRKARLDILKTKRASSKFKFKDINHIARNKSSSIKFKMSDAEYRDLKRYMKKKRDSNSVEFNRKKSQDYRIGNIPLSSRIYSPSFNVSSLTTIHKRRQFINF